MSAAEALKAAHAAGVELSLDEIAKSHQTPPKNQRMTPLIPEN